MPTSLDTNAANNTASVTQTPQQADLVLIKMVNPTLLPLQRIDGDLHLLPHQQRPYDRH